MIGIVTTFSDAGYKDYAHHLVNGLIKFLDPKIQVFLYVDTVQFAVPKNFNLIPLEPSVPELTKFKKRHCDKKVTDFWYDGVRFSHKSYAMWHAASYSNVNKLFWLDADTIVLNSMNENYFEKFLPNNIFTSYLGRPGRYTETGFLGFNLDDKEKNNFFSEFIDYYNNDRIYTELDYQTDCHVYDATRRKFVEEGKIIELNLTPGMGKNNFNSAHKGHMIHNKGDRKYKFKGK